MAAENDVQDQGFGDEAAFRRLQSRRKAKSLEFLQDHYATFNLLLTCILAASTAHITAYCFELVNAGKQDLVASVPDRENKRKRRRMRHKGLESTSFAVEPRKRSFFGVKVRCDAFVKKSWDALLGEQTSCIDIAGPFWPTSEPRSLQWKAISEHILRGIAAIKWRILVPFSTPPWNLSEERDDSMQEFLDAKPCCIDKYWSKPLQQHLDGLGDSDQQKTCFNQAVQHFLGSIRPVSLREEQSHAFQRRVAAGDHAAPLSSNIQRSASVIQAIKKNYEMRGGRNLNYAVPHVQKAIRKRAMRPGVFQRPNQTGNCLFFFLAQKRKQGDQRNKQELTKEWNELGNEAKEWWRSRFKIHCNMRRQQTQAAKQFAKDHELPSAPTPWNIGDEAFPIRADMFRDFLARFRGKEAGLKTLQTIMDQSHHSQEIADYIDLVQGNQEQYHMKKALQLACSHDMGPALDSDGIRDCNLAREIMATKTLSMGCHEQHPGLCKTLHAGKQQHIQHFVQVLPRKSCLLRFTVGNFVAHAQCILGHGH